MPECGQIKFPENRNLASFSMAYVVYPLLLPTFFWALRCRQASHAGPAPVVTDVETGPCWCPGSLTRGCSATPAVVCSVQAPCWRRLLCFSALPRVVREGRAAFSPPARQMDGLCRHIFLVCSDCLTWHRPPFPRNSVSRHLAGMTPLTNKVVRFLLMLVTAVLARREHQFFYSCCLVRSYLTA